MKALDVCETRKFNCRTIHQRIPGNVDLYSSWQRRLIRLPDSNPMTSHIYPCRTDAPEIPEAHYSRLCPRENGNWDEFDPVELVNLAQLMRDSLAKRRTRENETAGISTMPAGYVYLGQFIDHDITRDGRLLRDAGPDVEQTLNYRTPRLDLDVLYGRDPTAVSCIYEEGGKRLKLGPTIIGNVGGREIPATQDDDLLRSEDGTAVVMDPRSDENLIIAQLHVLFAKFHNRVLELLEKEPMLSAGPIGGSLFEQARRFVTWHYQWIVLNDFLPRIAKLDVLRNIQENGVRFYPRRYMPNDGPMALPVEFTVAAFRFGHSMIQDQYRLNMDIARDSGEIIRMTKRGEGISTHLPASHIVNWRFFLTGVSNQMNRAQHIDAYITEALYDLPSPIAQAFRFQASLMSADSVTNNVTAHPPLPEMTLKRGSSVRLPSGQELADYFKRPRISPLKMPPLPDDRYPFPDVMRERTPLWYYLLREAAIESTPKSGSKLGTLGSRIVAETFYQLLNADSESIFHAGCCWKPPVFTFSGQEWRLRTMSNLARFAIGA
jgi:hypothetical protein